MLKNLSDSFKEIRRDKHIPPVNVTVSSKSALSCRNNLLKKHHVSNEYCKISSSWTLEHVSYIKEHYANKSY